MTTMVELMQSAPIYRILDTPIRKSKLQSAPRPFIYLSDSSDEDDCATEIEDQPNNSLTYHRSSLSSIYSDCYREQSSLVKSTRHDRTDSCPKKAVHFADEFGLELRQMKIIDADELPSIPDEAFKHLQITQEHHPSPQECAEVITYMEPKFENPLYREGFNDRVSRQKVVLEQSNVIDNRIYGTIRSVSLGLHKRVKIRLTTDNWISFQDYDATYINHFRHSIYDRFAFMIEIDSHQMCAGNTIQFCICYECLDGPEYWDNNSLENYQFNCLS